MRAYLAVGLAMVPLLACGKADSSSKEKPSPPEKASSEVKVPESKPGPGGEKRAAYELDLADVHLKHGRFDRAFDLFLRVRKETKNPLFVTRATYGMALVHLNRGEKQLALVPLRGALESLNPESRSRIRFLIVSVLSDLRRYADAERELDEMLLDRAAAADVRARIYRQLVELYAARKDFPALAKKLEEKLEKNPRDAETLAALESVYENLLRDPARAFVFYEKILKGIPENAAYLRLVSDKAADAGKLDRAVELLETLVKRTETDPVAGLVHLRRLARLQFSRKKWDAALSALERAEKICKDDGRRREIRGDLFRTLRAAGRLQAKIRELEKKEKDESALRDLLLIYLRVTAAPLKAEEAAKTLLVLHPKDASLLADAVVIARMRGDRERIAAYVGRLLEVDAEAATNFMDDYVGALQFLGKGDEAVAALRRLADRDPANRVGALDRVAGILLQAGRKEEALESWRKMVAAIGASKDAADHLRGVALLKARGMAGDAWNLAQAALRLTLAPEQRAALLLDCVDLLEMQGKVAEAERLAREVAARGDIPIASRQAAERKVIALLQAQGKRIDVGAAK